MTREECFQAWAPDEAVWSRWAKPVLFAQDLGGVTPADILEPKRPGLPWLSPAGGRTAVIVDLPGIESVFFGVELARRGFRPVPLYNTSVGPASVVDARTIAHALINAAEAMRAIVLPREAPPAFLLDSQRMRPAVLPGPGKFDNRWVAFPQDFPSATFLRANGVEEALLLHDSAGLQEDLAHVLLRWQNGGVRVVGASPADQAPHLLEIKKPRWFRGALYRMIAAAGLRRNNAGGFGGVVPAQSSGGFG